jgi:hypothetical protein
MVLKEIRSVGEEKDVCLGGEGSFRDLNGRDKGVSYIGSKGGFACCNIRTRVHMPPVNW